METRPPNTFQATFLALARNAASVGRGEALGGWLYRTASRVALPARGRRGGPRGGGLPLPEDVPAPPAGEAAGLDLGPALDEEVGRLPSKAPRGRGALLLPGDDNRRDGAEAGAAGRGRHGAGEAALPVTFPGPTATVEGAFDLLGVVF